MVEPFNEPSYGNSKSAQTSHWRQHEPFPRTERNDSTNRQLVDSDGDSDDVKFVSLVKSGPSHLAQTVDLNEYIFDVTNDAGPSHAADKICSSRLAETVDLKRSIFDFVNGNDVAKVNNGVHSLSNHHTRQTITTGQFEPGNNVTLPNPFSQTLPRITKENVQSTSNGNGANASNRKLNALNWENALLFDNHVTGQLPKTTLPATAPATSTNTANVSKWEDVFEETNLPTETLTATNNPQPGPSRANVGFFAPHVTNTTAHIANNEPNRRNAFYGENSQPLQYVQPKQLAPLQVPIPPPFAPHQNQPGPFGPQLASMPAPLPFIPQQNHPGPFVPQHAIPPTALLFPLQQDQPGPFVPQRAIPPTPFLANQQARQEMIHTQQAFDDAIPNWYQQANEQIFHLANNYPAQNHPTIINGNMKRKGFIPIKVVRSTKQYETLVDMGFPKKDIETALRKCNLDLYETIEYLSEDKCATKRRKTEQNTPDLFHVYNPNQVHILQ